MPPSWRTFLRRCKRQAERGEPALRAAESALEKGARRELSSAFLRALGKLAAESNSLLTRGASSRTFEQRGTLEAGGVHLRKRFSIARADLSKPECMVLLLFNERWCMLLHPMATHVAGKWRHKHCGRPEVRRDQSFRPCGAHWGLSTAILWRPVSFLAKSQ
jgi:hypothetical protein